MNQPYTHAWLYDKLYHWKNYGEEAEKLLTILKVPPGGRGGTLLEVACGTGRFMEHLSGCFDAEGLDLSESMLEAAAERCPGVLLHHGDMRNFRLGKLFDAVICLFSSIGYCTDENQLRDAISSMALHLKPGGTLVVEPWFTPETWKPGSVHCLTVDEPDLKIARMSTSLVSGRLSVFDMHHLVGTPEGVTHLVERHEMGLFTGDQMIRAFSDAGLEVEHNPEGLTGRGLYVATWPSHSA